MSIDELNAIKERMREPMGLRCVWSHADIDILITEVERLRKALEDLLKAAKESHVVNRETTATLYAAEDMARKALTQ